MDLFNTHLIIEVEINRIGMINEINDYPNHFFTIYVEVIRRKRLLVQSPIV